MKCKYCKQEIPEGMSFCTNCGREITKNTNKKPYIIVGIWTAIAIFMIVMSFVSLFKHMNDYKINPATEKEFLSEINKLGCETINVQEINPNNAFDFYYVTNETCPYIIAYAKFNDSSAQNNFYSTLVKDVQNVPGSTRTTTSVNITNYSEYTYIANEYRSAATTEEYVLYIKTDKGNKELVNNLKTNLRFKYKMNFKFLYYFAIAYAITLLLLLISWWKLNKKMNRPGWIVLIPIYNLMCLCEDVMGKKIYALFLFIPFVNFFFLISLSFNIPKVFGKSDGYQILSVFFSSITIPLIAFDDSKYTKPSK